MGISAGPNSISNGLVMDFDIMNPRSYSGIGNTVYNLANSGIAGTIVSGIIYDSGYRKNLNFNGSSGYIISNDTSMDFTNKDFTIQTVIKLNGLSNGFFGAYGSVICAGNTLTNNSSIFQFLGTATSHYGIGLWHQPTSTTVGANFNFQTNRIYNIAVTKNSNQIEFFVNGASIGTTSSSSYFNFTASGFNIGRWYFTNSEQYLKGSIYELKSYNRALSTQEILQNYNSSRKRYLPDENIVKNGLVLNIDCGNYLSYSGVGNTTYDLSGFGNTATLVNGTGFGTTGGGTFLFDGTNDYLEAPHSASLDISGSITVDVWVYMTSLSNSGDPNLLCKYSNAGGASNQSWILFKSTGNYRSSSPDGLTANSNEFCWLASSSGNYSGALIGTGEQVSTNTWYNVVAIYNSSNEKMQMYLNGQLKTNVTRTGQTSGVLSTNLRNLQIGGTPLDSERWLQGRIPIARVYNRALSATEVMQNFNAMRERYNL